MAQPLSTVLAGDISSILSTHVRWLMTIWKSAPGVLDPSSLHGYCMSTHRQAQIYNLKKCKLSVVAYTFNTLEAEAGRSLQIQDQAWFTQCVLGQWELLSLALSQKEGKERITKKLRRDRVLCGTVKK